MKRLILFALIFNLVGCASLGRRWKAFLDGDQPQAQNKENPDAVVFSEQKNVLPASKRQYRRMTKQQMQEEAQLDDHAGSLWTMEGQGAYLFAQNIVRMIGDPIAVNLDGDPRSQVETKVSVIKKLLDRIEARQKEQLERDIAAESGNPPPTPAPEAAKAKPPAAAAGNKAEEEKNDFKVANVPARVVERTVDGNYRIKGSQPFMIGSRDYRVIVTGVVRAEDFSDEGVSATKLLDPKFDVVSARQKDD